VKPPVETASVFAYWWQCHGQILQWHRSVTQSITLCWQSNQFCFHTT